METFKTVQYRNNAAAIVGEVPQVLPPRELPEYLLKPLTRAIKLTLSPKPQIGVALLPSSTELFEIPINSVQQSLSGWRDDNSDFNFGRIDFGMST